MNKRRVLSEIDFSNCVENWRKHSPRVNDLAGRFAAIATGISNKPSTTPLEEESLEASFQGDIDALAFYEVCKERFGVFGRHFIASVPYSLQEWCRLGAAVTQYLLKLYQQEKRPTFFQSIGSAEGVIARSVAELGQGAIYTLTNSSTAENQVEFYKNAPKTAFFFSGPYFDISPDLFRIKPELEIFKDGFDIIFEDTCFQMHATNRKEQIAWVCQNLRDDGLFLAWEKCSLEENEEYQRREYLKDTLFKSRYFTVDQIKEKGNTILNRMETGQVSLKKLVEDISFTFKHAAVIWNSGNFYTIVAANQANRIEQFCNYLAPPYIPENFNHIKVPDTLHGPKLNLLYRPIQVQVL